MAQPKNERGHSSRVHSGRNYIYQRNDYDDKRGRPGRGPYSGYGPQGYQRPDAKISEDVNDRLTQHGQFDASDISVTVTAGTVVLDGWVDTGLDRRLAEDVVDGVSGVWDVHNHLRVRNPEP